MGLKNEPVVDNNTVTLSTQTENWLFNRIWEERTQNKDLKRTINDLKGQITNQQELLQYLAENLTNKDPSTLTDEASSSSPSGNDPDEECAMSDQETEGQQIIKKRKLSDSADKANENENQQ